MYMTCDVYHVYIRTERKKKRDSWTYWVIKTKLKSSRKWGFQSYSHSGFCSGIFFQDVFLIQQAVRKEKGTAFSEWGADQSFGTHQEAKKFVAGCQGKRLQSNLKSSVIHFCLSMRPVA